jgi:hypothetical protein
MINLMNGKAESRKESVGANFFNKVNKMKYFKLSMKNVAAIVACFAVSIMFSGCGKDKDDEGDGGSAITKLEISVVDGSKYSSDIDKVKLMVLDYADDYNLVELLSVDYSNGSFTINLPATVAAKYMRTFKEVAPDGVKVSNENARTASTRIDVYKGNDRVDWLTYGKVINRDKELAVYGYLMYSDSDVSITGTGTMTDEYEGEKTYIHEITITYSVNLKKGWNLIFETEEEHTVTDTSTEFKEVYKGKATSTDPGGLKWYMKDDFYALLYD